MSRSVEGLEDRTLLLDMLRPFWKAVRDDSSEPVQSTSQQQQHHPSAAVKLDFKRSSSPESTPPAKKSKAETSASPSPSPWQINRYKLEVLDSRVQIDKLEKQISHQHLVRKEMEELFENERQLFISERKSKENSVAELENRLQKARNKEIELREQISKHHRDFAEHRHAADKDKQAMMKEIYDLKGDVATAKINFNDQISKLKTDNLELSQNYETAQKKLNEYKSAYEEASVNAAKYIDLQDAYNKQTVMLQQKEMRLRDIENTKKDMEEVKVLQKRLTNLPQLERDAARLREENTELRAAARQNLLLEEQVQFFKTRIESLEPVYQNYCELQKKHLETEKTLEEWKRLGDVYEASDPQKLHSQLERLQQRELSLLSEKKDAEASLTLATTELANIKHEAKKNASKLSDVQSIQKNQESLIHRLQKKLLLVSRERDSYRHQLDSYEKELTVNFGNEPHNQMGVNVMNNRIDALEKTVQGYKDLVAKMEDDMTTTRGNPAQQEQLMRLKEEIINLTRENETLRARSDKVETQLEQSLLKHQEIQAPTMKILHMPVNPVSKAQDDARKELERAKAEVQHLKYRIKKLEANELEMSQRLSETMMSQGPTSEEYNQLKEQLESNKLKLQRMKEVYKSSSQEYRDVCYMLLGYRVDRIGANSYRLSSMYANSEDDYLSFISSDGSIEMVQTDYTATIGDLVEEHLQRHKSFPVFLSELTLDLFKKMTIVSDDTTMTD